ncbi:MAG: hypothetical protein MJ078_05235, partial [Clostridia bacterium]|nr:hypothetical protein [Clostridia bacterium]
MSFPVADSRLLFSLYRQMEEAEKAGKHLSLLSLFYRLAAEIWENGEEKRGFAADLIEKNLSDSGLTAKKIADSLYISE